MGYRIKPGYQIMQKGKIYTEGCILKEVESDLSYMVELVDESQNEVEKQFVDGLEKVAVKGKKLEPNPEEPKVDVNSIGIADPETIRKGKRK